MSRDFSSEIWLTSPNKEGGGGGGGGEKLDICYANNYRLQILAIYSILKFI